MLKQKLLIVIPKNQSSFLKEFIKTSYFAFFPLYSPILSRLLWVFSPNEFCVSKLIFCQNHLRLMAVVFVYPLSTLPGYVFCFSPLPLNSCQQVYRATPLLYINVGNHRMHWKSIHKEVCRTGLDITKDKHKFCHKLDKSFSVLYLYEKTQEGSEFQFLNFVSWLTFPFIQHPPPVKFSNPEQAHLGGFLSKKFSLKLYIAPH